MRPTLRPTVPADWAIVSAVVERDRVPGIGLEPPGLVLDAVDEQPVSAVASVRTKTSVAYRRLQIKCKTDP